MLSTSILPWKDKSQRQIPEKIASITTPQATVAIPEPEIGQDIQAIVPSPTESTAEAAVKARQKPMQVSIQDTAFEEIKDLSAKISEHLKILTAKSLKAAIHLATELRFLLIQYPVPKKSKQNKLFNLYFVWVLEPSFFL